VLQAVENSATVAPRLRKTNVRRKSVAEYNYEFIQKLNAQNHCTITMIQTSVILNYLNA